MSILGSWDRSTAICSQMSRPRATGPASRALTLHPNVPGRSELHIPKHMAPRSVSSSSGISASTTRGRDPVGVPSAGGAPGGGGGAAAAAATLASRRETQRRRLQERLRAKRAGGAARAAAREALAREQREHAAALAASQNARRRAHRRISWRAAVLPAAKTRAGAARLPTSSPWPVCGG